MCAVLLQESEGVALLMGAEDMRALLSPDAVQALDQAVAEAKR